jgi:hypothetical protein
MPRSHPIVLVSIQSFLDDCTNTLIHRGYTKACRHYDRIVAKSCRKIVRCIKHGRDYTSVRMVVDSCTEMFEQFYGTRETAIKTLHKLLSACHNDAIQKAIERRLAKMT